MANSVNLKTGRLKGIGIVVVLALIALGAWKLGYIGGGDEIASDGNDSTKKSESTTAIPDGTPELDVAVCSWPIFAGGPVFNEGFRPNGDSRYFEEYGFVVNFKIMDNFQGSRDALIAGEVDLLWGTLDAFPVEAQGMSESDVKVVYQTDWSRGGDLCVVYEDAGVNSINDFEGKNIAVSLWTPSHSMLLQNLRSVGLTQDDVNIIPVDNPEAAATAFIDEAVDIAYVWDPFQYDCLSAAEENHRSAKILTSTKLMSNSIPAVWLAKADVIDQKEQMMIDLFTGWMVGNAEINTNKAQFEKANQMNFDAIGLYGDLNESRQAMGNGRFVTAGDNANFFGLNKSYKGVTAKQLYTEMAKLYQEAGEIDDYPRYNQVFDDRIVQGVTARLSGGNHVAENNIIQEEAPAQLAQADAVSSKAVSIYFDTNESTLDPNAKIILNSEFELEATTNTGGYIRIIGNTDDQGNKAHNIALSQKRANAVADYMVEKWGINRNRIITVGNGPAKARKDNVKGANDEYRRTDFEIVSSN